MDAPAFDRLVTRLATINTRRGLLRVLSALPVFGVLAVLMGAESTAKNRRQRSKDSHHDKQKRKQRHRDKVRRRTNEQRQQERKKERDKCAPVWCDVCYMCEPRSGACVLDPAQVGAQCGDSDDGQLCQSDGRCACELNSCIQCHTCDTTSGECVPDPATVGQPCGQPGQICQDDGLCECDATSCASGATCCFGRCEVLQCGCSCDEVCTASGECAIPCVIAFDPDGDICFQYSPTCECGKGYSGDEQDICVDGGSCFCVDDCADCHTGHVCQGNTGTGGCAAGQHVCCPLCGV